MKYLVPLWKHQLDAVEKSKIWPNMALLWDVGTGKTPAMINIIRQKFNDNGRIMKTLIFAPPVVLQNWVREFKAHSTIDPRFIYVSTGVGKTRGMNLRNKLYDSVMNNYSAQKIVLMNYEAIQNDIMRETLHLWQPEIMVCDEAHRCKNHESIRAKAISNLAVVAKHRYLLTGTPILNSLVDIFQQFKILDQGDTFGKNFYAFRSLYFEDSNAAWAGRDGHFPKYIPRPTTYDEFQKKIYKKATRAIKSECLDLPPFIRTTREVNLSTEQAKAYKEMEKEFITYIQNEEKEKRAVMAQIALTKSLRLLQIITGFANDDKGVAQRIFGGIPRLNALSEVLEEITNQKSKVIVWATFKENYLQIQEVCIKLGLKYVELHGGIDLKQKQKNIDSFNNDASVSVMIANQSSGGIGVNLTSASYAVFYSRNFSLEQDLQAEGRNYRGGSEIHKNITRIDLVCPGTIDELVLECLAGKLNVSERVLSWAKGSKNGND